MTEHHVVIYYRADDIGSRTKPITIINDGNFGSIKTIRRLHPKGVAYSITLKTEDDPEDIFKELLGAGVFIVKMNIDGKSEFVHPKVRLISKERVHSKRR